MRRRMSLVGYGSKATARVPAGSPGDGASAVEHAVHE
jgi:hypothetical protein